MDTEWSIIKTTGIKVSKN